MTLGRLKNSFLNSAERRLEAQTGTSKADRFAMQTGRRLTNIVR